MDWLRLRKRAVEATFVNEYPTDARRAMDDLRGGEPDPDVELGRRLRRRVAIFLLYAVFIGGSVAALFGKGGVIQLLRLHGDLRTARTELSDQRRAVEELRRDVALLKDNPMSRERIAREELGLTRPGEVVFLLPRDEDESIGAHDPFPEGSEKSDRPAP